MQIQIPRPKPPVDQGATSQQTYVFPVNQPEPRRLADAAAVNAVANLPPTLYKSFDQGPTNQQTFPVPPVGQPPAQRYGYGTAEFRDARSITPQAVRLEGPTVQQTFPVPVTQEALPAWYGYDSRRIVGTTPQLDGFVTPSAPQTYVFPVNQPEPIRTKAAVEVLRYIVGTVPQLDGATNQQTYVFPVNQVEPTRVRTLNESPRYLVGTVPQFGGATLQQTYVFPVNQPEPTRVRAFNELLRYIVGAVPQLDGPTVQQTYVFPTNQPELTRVKALLETLRYVVNVVPRFEGPTTQATFVFPVSQPEFKYYLRNTQAPRWVPLETLVPPVGAQTYEFYPNQPELSRWLPLDVRYRAEPVKRFEGPTTQQLYEFFPQQPSIPQWWKPNNSRYLIDAVKVIDQGPTVQQTYVFAITTNPVLALARQQPRLGTTIDVTAAAPTFTHVFAVQQPELSYYGRQPRFSSVFTPIQGPTTQQLFQFFPQQPEQSRWWLPRLPFIVGTVPQFDGPFAQQTYIFHTEQPRVADYGQRVPYAGVFRPIEGAVTLRDQEFPVNQPLAARWWPPNRVQLIVEARKALDQGPPRQQTYIFPLLQPGLDRYTWRRHFRVFDISILDSVSPRRLSLITYSDADSIITYYGAASLLVSYTGDTQAAISYFQAAGFTVTYVSPTQLVITHDDQ